MRIKSLTMVLLLSMNSLVSYAQLELANHKPPVPLSPQAAELFKFINVPVDFSRGLVPISIPLYTIKSGDLELPISLNYHSSGIKVHEPSSVVGLGWSLQAEPQLSRIVNGLPDEAGFLSNSQLGSNSRTYLWSLLQGSADEQPDEFAFSLLKTNGKFFYSRTPGSSTRNIKTVPYVPIKVDDSSNSFWQLIDDLGIRYYFGRTESFVEMDNLKNISSWKATEIINANRTDTISFKYAPKDYDYLMYRTLPVDNYIIKDSTSMDLTESYGDGSVGGLTPSDVQQAKIHITKYLSNTTFSQKYSYDDPNNPFTLGGQFLEGGGGGPIEVEVLTINEIKFRGGKVVFEKGVIPNSQYSNKAINRILVYDDLSQVVKEIKFTYEEIPSYFKGNSNFSQGRFFLKKIAIVADGKEEAHTFDYDSRILPYYNTKEIDLWGYYNGATGNTELVQPTSFHVRRYGSVSQNLTLGSANRDPDFMYAQAGVLTKITYPTGGFISFGYELNQVLNNATNQLINVGGLRINSIYNGNSLRMFKYGKNEVGGGYIKNWVSSNSIYNPFIYEHHLFEDKVVHVGYAGDSQDWYYTPPTMINYRFRMLSSQPIFDITYKGVGAVYPEVTEYVNDNLNGKIVYKFNFASFGNSPYSSPMYVNGTTISVDGFGDWKYGSELSKTTYKGGEPYQIIAHKGKNEIPEEFIDAIWSRKIYPTTKVINSDGYNTEVSENEVYYAFQDNIVTGYLKVVADTVIDYSSLGASTLIQQYNYTNPTLPFPTEEILIGSDNSRKKKKRYYPSDLIGIGDFLPYQEMVNRNQVSVPIIEEYYVGSTLKQKSTTSFSQGWDNPFLILPSAVKFHTTGYPEETRLEFMKYDSFGNLLQVRKDNILNISYLYGYKNNYLIAEVNNLTYSVMESLLGGQSALKAFAYSLPTDLQLNAFLSPLRTSPSLSDTQLSTFTYKPLIGMTSVTDPKGTKISYSYDGFGRLKTVKDRNGQIVKAYDYHYNTQ